MVSSVELQLTEGQGAADSNLRCSVFSHANADQK